MNDKNQTQGKVQPENKVPDDLLILVDSYDSSSESNNSVVQNNSENNIFIKDFSETKIENAEIKNTNTKLNFLLGTTEISNIKNLTTNKMVNNNGNNNNINRVNKITNNGSDNSTMNLDSLMKNTYNDKVELEKMTVKSNKSFLITSIISGVVFVIVLFVAIFSKGINFSFRGEEAYFQDRIIEKTSQFQTSVVTDNIYTNVVVNNISDAKSLIVKDSTNQKNKCTNAKVKEIETRIEKKYGIVAVNFCELQYKFALEIEKVLDNIYKEFPNTIKGYLTNLTLSNMGEYGPIASFVSAKLFAKSNTFTTYPNVYKTSIFLNAEYFLNGDRFIAEMEQSEGAWFVKNATRSSIVAHEFGHYLSFVAQLNNTQNINEIILLTKKNFSTYYKLINDSNEGFFSKKIIQEAYENVINDKKNNYSDIEQFRASISEYAVATDDYGEPIYDETIAEAYHDWYLNKQKAKVASKAIVSVLKKYINN